MPLADIAHIGQPLLHRGRAEGTLRHHRRRFRRHPGQQRIHPRHVETGEALIEAADHLIPDRRAEEPDRAPHPRAGGHQQPFHPDLLGHPVPMHRPAATEGDDAPPLHRLAALDRMDPRRVRHVLIDHLDYAERRHLRRQPEPPADLRRQRRPRRLRIEPQIPPREKLRVVAAEGQVRIRHRRPQPAAAVAGRPRIRPRALGPDGDAPHAVHRRERPAAGADLHHLDHRNPQRQAGALLEPADARHLEGAGGLRLILVDHADLRGRPAHVEGQHLGQPALLRDMGGEDRPARRPGFHQPDRVAHRRLEGGEPAAREHHEQRAGEAAGAEPGLQPLQIARHQRLHIGVGDGGREALPLPHLR